LVGAIRMTDITPTRRELADIARRRHVKEARQKAKAARPVSPKSSRGRERNNAYLAWLRRQPCVARHMGGCDGPVEAAHIRTGDLSRGKPLTGMGVKPSDRFATSLCRAHHAAQHARGNEMAWWRSIGLDPFTTAEGLFNTFNGERP